MPMNPPPMRWHRIWFWGNPSGRYGGRPELEYRDELQYWDGTQYLNIPIEEEPQPPDPDLEKAKEISERVVKDIAKIMNEAKRQLKQ